MKPPVDVQKIVAPYTALIDAELQHFFDTTPDLPMYGHLAYFMGFKNEHLAPEVTYGGKRFRSSVMLMLSDWFGAKEAALPYAVALELYHNFTLIHDDVVDRDTHRRGRPTVWSLFGHDHAINSGDAQLLLMAELLAQASTGSVSGARTQQFLLAQFRVVVEGQYLDFELTNASLGAVAVTQQAYEDMIRRKTAELIVAAVEGVGILTDQSDEVCRALATYARSLGMAYQICDDVVSIWATGETTGKRNYGDIKERKKTLPIIYAYEKLTGTNKQSLVDYYAQNELTDAECADIIALLDTVDTKKSMEVVIEQYAEQAKTAARTLPLSSEQHTSLCALVDSLLPKV